MNRDRVCARLTAREPLRLDAGGATRAAVLVPLRDSAPANGVEVVLTRRSEDLADHQGQVAFPGGRVEQEDATPIDAALREAYEELGIPPRAVDVVARLDDSLTTTGYHVVPVVGWLPPDLPLVANPSEVARVFSVPLGELLRSERWEQRPHTYRGEQVLVWHFAHDGEDVWGATANILRGMLAVLLRSPA